MDYHDRPQAITIAEALGLNIEDLAVWQIIHPDGEIEEPWYWNVSYSAPDPSDHFGFTKEQISKVVKSCNKNAKNYQLIPKFEFDGEGHYVKLDAKSDQPLERVIGDIKWDLEEAIKEML